MEIKETAVISRNWKDGFSVNDLDKLAKWLSKFMDGSVTVNSIHTDDREELMFIRTNG